MNAKKDRYAVRISEASYTEMQEQALRDGAVQGIAVTLVTLDRVFGWRGVRLKRALDAIEGMLTLSILDKDITAANAVEYLRKEYGVDCDKLPIDADASGGSVKRWPDTRSRLPMICYAVIEQAVYDIHTRAGQSAKKHLTSGCFGCIMIA